MIKIRFFKEKYKHGKSEANAIFLYNILQNNIAKLSQSCVFQSVVHVRGVRKQFHWQNKRLKMIKQLIKRNLFCIHFDRRIRLFFQIFFDKSVNAFFQLDFRFDLLHRQTLSGEWIRLIGKQVSSNGRLVQNVVGRQAHRFSHDRIHDRIQKLFRNVVYVYFFFLFFFDNLVDLIVDFGYEVTDLVLIIFSSIQNIGRQWKKCVRI